MTYVIHSLSHAHAHTYTRTQAETWLRLCLLLFPFAEQQRFRFLRSIRDVGVVFFCCEFFFSFFGRALTMQQFEVLWPKLTSHTHTHSQMYTHTNTLTCTHKRTSAKIVQNITSLLCARLPLPNNTNIERELTRRFATSVGQKEAQPHAIASARALRVFREVSRHESDGTLAPNGRGAN